MEVVIGLVVVVVLAIAWVVSLKNTLVETKNKIKRSWSEVLVHVQKKVKVLEKLEQQLKDYQGFEQGTLEKIVKLRQGISTVSKDSSTVEQVQRLESEYANAMKGLSLTVEQYPDLKTSSIYLKTMQEVVDQQEDVSASISIYNGNVERFNNTIMTFPNSVLNSMFFHEKEINFFEDKTMNIEKEVGFTPNL